MFDYHQHEDVVTRGGSVLIAIEDQFYSSICHFPSSPKVTCIDQLAEAVYMGNVKILIVAVYIPPADANDDLSSV